MSNKELIAKLVNKLDGVLTVPLVPQSEDGRLKVVPHSASTLVGSHNDRNFDGTMLTEKSGDVLMIIRLWADGEFDVRPVSRTGALVAEQVSAIWTAMRGDTDGKV